jgi:putative spermidine/putrescine transport system substrate-binding protein
MSKDEVIMSSLSASSINNARIYEGKHPASIWDGQVFGTGASYLVAVAGKKQHEALEFMKHASSAKLNAIQAKQTLWSPMRKSSMDIIENNPSFERKNGTWLNVMPSLSTNPEHMKTAVIYEPNFWTDNGREIQQRFEAWRSAIKGAN